MGKLSGSRGRWMAWAAALLLLILSPACRASSAAGDAPIVPAIIAPTATPVPAPSLEQRHTVAVTATAPPSPTSVQTSTPDTQATAIPIAASPTTPTATPPPPTFTPPPPPPIVEGEHLWLQRPVPPSGPTWTDKTYPYGSTRGGTLRPHTGVEFVVPSGTPVLAVAPGTVVVAGDDSLIAYGPSTNFYGNLVIIALDNQVELPIFTVYGHLSEVSVSVGQVVAAGELLGYSGASGVADGPHLHFEVRVGQNEYGATRNPLLWLAPLPETGIVAGRVVNSNGELLYEAPVALVRVDGTAPYSATTSYAPGEPNADAMLGENFALDDAVPGFYQLVVDTGGRRAKADLWVYPGRTNWVEVVVDP